MTTKATLQTFYVPGSVYEDVESGCVSFTILNDVPTSPFLLKRKEEIGAAEALLITPGVKISGLPEAFSEDEAYYDIMLFSYRYVAKHYNKFIPDGQIFTVFNGNFLVEPYVPEPATDSIYGKGVDARLPS